MGTVMDQLSATQRPETMFEWRSELKIMVMKDAKKEPKDAWFLWSQGQRHDRLFGFSSELRICFCHSTVVSSRSTSTVLHCFIQLQNVDILRCPSAVGNPQLFEDEEEPKERQKVLKTKHKGWADG